MWVLLTGMSGTGKSRLVRELERRDFAAYDADDDGLTEPGGRWAWRVHAVRVLLTSHADQPMFFAGCGRCRPAGRDLGGGPMIELTGVSTSRPSRTTGSAQRRSRRSPTRRGRTRGTPSPNRPTRMLNGT